MYQQSGLSGGLFGGGSGFGRSRSLLETDPALASQYQFSNQAMAQGMSTAPVQSWGEGLARALQGAVGGYFQGQAVREAEGRDKAASDLFGRAISESQGDPRKLSEMLAGNRDTRPLAQQIMLASAFRKPDDPSNRFREVGGRLVDITAPGGPRVVLDTPEKPQDPRQNYISTPNGLGQIRPDGSIAIVPGTQPRGPAGPAAPDGVREFQFARQNGFQGNYLEFLQQKSGRSGGPFAGSGMDAQDRNNLLTLPPEDPRYAMSFNALYGRRTVTQPDGTTVEIQPPVPSGIVPPGGARQPSQQTADAGSQPAQPLAQQQAATAATGANVSTVQTPGGATVTRIGSPREKDLTEAQAKANLFGGQMQRAEGLLKDLRPPSNAAIVAWRNAPESMVNLGLNENDQAYFNALRTFAAGVLRKETGAAFTANELLDVQSRFFPMPGDNPRMVEQKAANRQQALESIRSELPRGEFRGIIQPQPQPPAQRAPLVVPPQRGAAPPPRTGIEGQDIRGLSNEELLRRMGISQ